VSVEKAIEAIKVHKYEHSINIFEKVLLSKSIELNDLIICYENINKLLMIKDDKKVLNLFYACGEHLKDQNLHEEAIACFETILEYESLDRGTEILYMTWDSLLHIGELELANQYSFLYLNFCIVKKLFHKGLIYIEKLEERYIESNSFMKYKISFYFMNLDNKRITENIDNIFHLYYTYDKKIYIDALELVTDIREITPPEDNELKQIYILALYEKIKEETNLESRKKLRNIFIEHMYILIILNPEESYLYILMTEYSLLFNKKEMGLKSLLNSGELPRSLEGAKKTLELLPDEQLNEDNDPEIFVQTTKNKTEIVPSTEDSVKIFSYKNIINRDDIIIPEQVLKNSFRLIDDMSDSDIDSAYIDLTTSLIMMRQFEVVDYLLQRVTRNHMGELSSGKIINIHYLIVVNKFRARKYHQCLSLSEVALLQLPLMDKEKVHFLYLLGDSYFHLKKYKSALSAFKKVKELNSNYRNIKTRMKFLESL